MCETGPGRPNVCLLYISHRVTDETLLTLFIVYKSEELILRKTLPFVIIS